MSKDTSTNKNMNQRQENQLHDAIDILSSIRRNANYTQLGQLTHPTRNSFDAYQQELASRAISLIEKALSDGGQDYPLPF